MMDELTLIKTPNSYIKLGAKRTLLQQDSLLMVSAHLQEYVKTFFELGLHHSGVSCATAVHKVRAGAWHSAISHLPGGYGY